jgi:peptidyl-prolyl cis-trans isomerase A (cyclophilin A)
MNNSVKQWVRVWLLFSVFWSGFIAPVFAATNHAVTASVTMETSLGSMEIELYGSAAPVTVANFLKHVEGDYFDGTEFYRVVTYANDNGSPKIEVIQGGLNNQESPFPPIDHETTEFSGIAHTDGVISMARGGVGSATSEFFVCIGDQLGLDFGQPRNQDMQGFAAFGKVVKGMDIARQINASSGDAVTGEGYTSGQILVTPITIIAVSVKYRA